MSGTCGRDCVERLRFPRTIANRPGLSRIRYRLGSYADIRAALLRGLDTQPVLAQWTYRGSDDPGIALLEGASILGDILTFYQELYANEAFLRTAQWRESIADLVRLLGYRLSPGLGGRATFAFEIKGNQPVMVPASFPVKAELADLHKPADFETAEPATAYPWLSRFSLFRPLLWPPVTAATRELYIEQPDPLTSPVTLKPGDRLLMGDTAASAPGRIDNSEIVIVDSTRVLHGTTLIKIKGALRPTTNATSLVAYKLGRTFRHFGYNGPPKKIIPPKTVTATSSTLASTIQPPPVTVQPQSVTIQPPPVLKQPPPMMVQPPSVTVPLLGNTNVIPSLRVTTPASPDTIFVLPDPPNPIGWQTSPQTVTVNPMPMAVTPPPVTVQPAPVTLQPQPVTVQPPLLQIPPANITTKTDVPPPTEESINFFRWLNYPANTFESIWSIVEPNLDMKEFPLDAEVQDLPSGLQLVAQFTAYVNASRTQKEERTLVRTIASVKPISMTWGLLSSNTTLVTLKDTLETVPLTVYLYTDIREFQVHETLSPQLTLKAAMQEDPAPQGADLLFYGTDAHVQPLVDRRVMLIAPGADPEIASVVDVQTLAANVANRMLLRRVSLDRNVKYADFPNEKPTRTFYGNLIDATEGKLERPVPIGNGDGRQTFQTFQIPKPPVTYLISAADTPPEVPELQIYVNGRLWTHVASLFDRKPDEEIYIVREDAEYHSWVQFGDGIMGARLPSGVKNVVAAYRTGTGAFGPLKPKSKVQPGARLEGLDAIQMPGVVSGGSGPEEGDSAREAAPGKIQSLDRLVSLEDFESEALAISGVTKAAAAWEVVENIPEVVLTVLMTTGRGSEIDSVRAALAADNVSRGPGRFPISVRQGQQQYVVVTATFGFDATRREEDVTAAVRLALGVTSDSPTSVDDQAGLFSVRRRGFGQREYATSIAGAIQRVKGVVWARVTRFESLGVANDPTTLAVSSSPIVIQPIVSCDSQNVLSLFSAHLQLVGVSVALSTVLT